MCGCNGGSSGPGVTTGQDQYEVRLPNGDVKIVNSEHEARVAVTRAGGGDFSRK
jgi:hypothetical protein